MKKLIAFIAVCFISAAAAAAGSSAPPVFQMRLVLDAPSGDSEVMMLVIKIKNSPHTNALNVQKTVLLDQTALKSATAATDALGQPVIEITFTDAGAKRFAEVTRQNIHKRLAIIIDGQLCEAPMIQMEIWAARHRSPEISAKRRQKIWPKRSLMRWPKNDAQQNFLFSSDGREARWRSIPAAALRASCITSIIETGQRAMDPAAKTPGRLVIWEESTVRQPRFVQAIRGTRRNPADGRREAIGHEHNFRGKLEFGPGPRAGHDPAKSSARVKLRPHTTDAS